MTPFVNAHTFLFQHNPRFPDVPQFCQPGFFFNEHPHLHHQNDGKVFSLSAINEDTQQADMRCAFFVQNDRAVSPLAAPFGSVEFSESIADSLLDSFIRALVKSIRRAGARHFRLVNYPACYAPQQTERLMMALVKHGFQVVENHQNFFLTVPQARFASQLVPAESRRLRKCCEAGFHFARQQAPNIQEVIDFLRNTRHQLGYQLPIGPERLISLLTKFPDSFSVFTVHDGPHLVALTITVRVRHDILYNFLPASAPDYHSFSPMVMLIDGLFGYCQQENINLLDLGVSLDADRQPKPGLIRFKYNLGAKACPKLTFEKAL